MLNFAVDTLPTITAQTALFLDFDGTLVELAATPNLVYMPADVIVSLSALQRKLQGALALVSGRSLSNLDTFTQPLRLACAGEHGSQRRSANGQVSLVAPVDLGRALHAAQALELQYPALLLERKSSGISLHYRQAPELESTCIAAMQAVVNHTTGLELLRGKCVVEVKPQAANKGTAITSFMQEAPFSGRQSIFTGDDTTDESGFAAVQSMGGQAIKVGSGPTAARYRCASVNDLLAWLRTAATQPDLPSQPTVSA
jgi:trehalose 6-phosphate phosphatase